MTVTRQGTIQGKAHQKALRNILNGVYYRHEFARRNNDIVGASDALLEKFPKAKAARVQDSNYLLQSTPLRTLTDWLIEDIDKERSGSLKKKRIKLLSAFLKTWRVFPVPPPDKPFMPFTLKEKDAQNDKILFPTEYLMVCWEKILRFETYAITKLGLDEPLFFPFVSFPEKKELFAPTLKNIIPNQPESKYKLVLIDWKNPSGNLHEYLTAWLIYRRVTEDKLREIQQIKDSGKEDRKTISWKKFPHYLLAFDFDKNPPPECKSYFKTEARAAIFNEMHPFPETKKEKKDSEINKALRITRRYEDWIKQGKYWVENYRLIVW